jgi:hypothetical protein
MPVPRDAIFTGPVVLVPVHLIRELGATTAVVMAVIAAKCASAATAHIDADGRAWYRSTREAMAAETGLGKDAARRAFERLVAEGHIDTAFHPANHFDRTKSYSPRTV